MKANELMIGDWVKVTNLNKIGKAYRIDRTNGEGNGWVAVFDGDYHESLLEPITLTPEVLEKNGFVLESYSGGVMSGKWWARNDFVIHESMNDSVGRNNFKYKYVHQLQHALRLCGIEKEIIL